jgi:hypothetical protein
VFCFTILQIIVTATISGTSVSFGTVVLSQSDSSGTYLGVGFDSTQNRVVGAFRNSTGVEGRSYVYDASVTAILGAENFVGISDGAYADLCGRSNSNHTSCW